LVSTESETSADNSQADPTALTDTPSVVRSPLTAARTAFAGMLMGIANLIPGVSGGTMVLAMGLYEEFISSVADITAFRIRVRPVAFLAVLGCFAVGSIVLLSGVILYLLFAHMSIMFALFIGLTLGGVPTLLWMIGRFNRNVVIGTLAGFLLMVLIALARDQMAMPKNQAMDVVSGVVGSTTMVLPGISGSYMLLLLNQYDRVVGAVDDLKQRSWEALNIVIPVGIGAVIGVIGLSNLLKLLLRRYEKVTLGFLLGMLLGSVLGLWPFGRAMTDEILEKRSVAELSDYAGDLGLKNVESMPHEELIEHLVVAWDVIYLDTDRIADKHEDEALRRLAEKEDIQITADLSGEKLAADLSESWGRELRHVPSTAEKVSVVIAAIIGFAITTSLSRLSKQRKPDSQAVAAGVD
jgi:putative membrane protein